MAFTLKIKGKSLFGNKNIDFNTLVKSCGLEYGHDNDFYMLEEGMENGIAILYNPKRMGRGIFLDGREMANGKVEISYNIPTTKSEIEDFINVVKELERQLKKVEMYCVEEERSYTVLQLEENKDRMIEFSRLKLNEFCGNPEYETKIFTLAMWPLVLTKEQEEKFAKCTDLDEFEQILHDKQNIDVYYAKPRLYQNKDGRIGAFYTLTEECESIFPTKANGFFSMEQIKIDDGFIQYYIFSENRVLEGLFDYDKFVANLIGQGAEYYDASHLLVPSMTKEQIEELAKKSAIILEE